LALVDAVKGKPIDDHHNLWFNDPASISVAIGALILIFLLAILMIWHQYKVKQIHLTFRNISSVGLLVIMSLGYFAYLAYSSTLY
jgi:uncharacterized membrane protein YbhN (UPF0104 family)